MERANRKRAVHKIFALGLVLLVAVGIFPVTVMAADHAPANGAALESLVLNSGDTITLQAGGTYELTQTLKLPANVTVTGNGATITCTSASFGGADIPFYPADAWRTSRPLVHFQNGGAISNVTLQGPGDPGKMTGGIVSQGNTTIENVDFIDIRDADPMSGNQHGQALVIMDGDATVKNCYFKDFQKTGIFSVTTGDVLVQSCTFENTRGVPLVASNGITVFNSGITIEDVSISDLQCGTSGANSTAVILMKGADAEIDVLTVDGTVDSGISVDATSSTTITNSNINPQGDAIMAAATSTVEIDWATYENNPTIDSLVDIPVWMSVTDHNPSWLVESGDHSVRDLIGGVIPAGQSAMTNFFDLPGFTASWATANTASATASGDTISINPNGLGGTVVLTLTATYNGVTKVYKFNVNVIPYPPKEGPSVTGSIPMRLDRNGVRSGDLRVSLGSSGRGAMADSADVTSADSRVATVNYDAAAGIATVTGGLPGDTVVQVRFFDAQGNPMTAYDTDVPVYVFSSRTSTRRKSSGGGGSGSGSGVYTPVAAQPATRDFTLPTGKSLFDSATAKTNGKAITFKATNYNEAKASVLKELADYATGKGKALKVHFDTVQDGKLVARVTVDPALASKTISTMLSMTDSRATSTTKKFEKAYRNHFIVVNTGQEGSYGMPVRISVKANLTSMDRDNLYFYSYDRATNKYSRIEKPNYRIDKNGYLQFTTEQGGVIVISSGALTKS